MARTPRTKTAPAKNTAPAKEAAPVYKKVPFDTMITVVNNVTNELVYVSGRMAGMKVMWDRFGESQYIELAELLSMRSLAPKFFEQNWVIIEPSEGYSAEEIYKTLGVDRYYKHVVTPKTLDKLYAKPLPYIEKEMASYSDSVKKLVYERAVQLRDTGEFDSISKFEAIKRLAGVEDIIEG